jgi:3-hydroxybutyryl-CoA dehydrogenase
MRPQGAVETDLSAWEPPERAQFFLITVAIIGAGPLGRWLALSAARAGYRVLLEDVMPANLHHAEEYLREELGHGALGQDAPRQDALGSGPPRVEYVSTVEDAVREADLAIDCVPDELESKLEILWLLDRMAPPRTVLATPTTRLSIADLASCTYRADRCVAIAMDPRDFSHVADSGSRVPLLLRTTERTAPETVKLVRDFWERLGIGTTVELVSI